MTPATARGLVRRVGPDPDPPADAELVARFARTADPAAFAALVHRHGPMVLAACRRMLPGSADADDAFQAVFLVLVRKAGAVRPPGAVGGWLHGVAVRTAQKARVAAARRRRREMNSVPTAPPNPGAYAPGSPEHVELRAALDAELGKLPEPLRAAVVLCDLGGKTRSEAAADLGCPEGTVAARLHRARKLLAERLARRGVTAPAALAVTTATVPSDLLASVAGFAAGGPVPPAVRVLAEGVVRSMIANPLSLAFAAVAAVALAGAGVLWAAAPPPDGTPPAAGAAAAADPPAAPPLNFVTDLAFAPDGKTVLVVAGGKATVKDAVTDRIKWTAPAEAARLTADGNAVVTMGKAVERRSADTGEVQTAAKRPKTELGWHTVAFTPEGARYAAHVGFEARVYDRDPPAEPFRLERSFGPPGGALLGISGKDVRFSPDGKLLAAVGVMITATDMGTAVWDAETGQRLFAYPPAGNLGEWQSTTAAAFSPDGKAFAVALGKSVRFFETARWVERVTLDDLPGSGTATALAFSPDGTKLAVGYRLPLPDGADKGKEPRVTGHKTEVLVIDLFSKDKTPRRFDGFEGVSHMGPTVLPVIALAFSPDGKTLLAGTGFTNMTTLPAGRMPPGEVKRFAPAAQADPPALWREKATLPRLEESVHSIAFRPDGKELTAGGKRAMITSWALPQLTESRYIYDNIRGRVPTPVAYSPDGRVFGLGAPGGFLPLDATTRRPLRGVSSPDGSKVHVIAGPTPLAVAFSPAVERVAGRPRYKAAITDGRAVSVLDWVEGAAPSTATFGPLKNGPKVDDPLPAGVAFAPLGRQLVFIPNHKIDPAFFTGKVDKAGEATHWIAHVWGGGSGEPMMPLPHGTAPVTAVAWSPDGKLIASGCRKGDVVLWDAKTFKELRRLPLTGRSGEGVVHALAFAPDGKTLAAAVDLVDGKNTDRVVMLDPATGTRGQDIQGFPSASPRALAFAPDGKTLAVGLAAWKVAQNEVEEFGLVKLYTTDPEPAGR